MQDILDNLHQQLNKNNYLSGLQIWSNALSHDLKDRSKANAAPSEVGKEILEWHASLLAELLLSTPAYPRPCPFLEVFRGQASDQESLMKKDGVLEKLIGPLESLFTMERIRPAEDSLLGQLQLFVDWTRGVELRCATLQLVWMAMGQKSKGGALENWIPCLINAYQKYFSSACWNEIPGKCNFRCAGYHRLSEIASGRGSKVGNNGNAAQAIVDAIEACRVTHLDPAVAFVCDTLALALGYTIRDVEPLGASWIPGDTWVLLGAENSKASSPTGMVLRLRTEKSETTPAPAQLGELCPGVYYPDPRMAAHCPIDENFQVGIRNAWFTTMHKLSKNGCNHDFRWHVAAIDRFNTQRRILGLSGLNGDSGTLAYAAAIRSCEEGKLLRQDSACTAAFEMEMPSHRPLETSTYANPRLAIVGLVADKANAVVWNQSQPAFANKIKRIIVAKKQPLEFLPAIPPVEISEWDLAWRELNHFEATISEFANESAQRWDQIKDSKPVDFVRKSNERLNDIHRLDLYVWPEFQWEDPNPKYLDGRGANENPWITTKLDSPRAEQLIEALKYGIENERGLVLLDGAGAGKTVTSLKVQQLLSEPKTSESIFGDNIPRLVFHWSSSIPSVPEAGRSLVTLLASDPSLLQFLSNSENASHLMMSVHEAAKELVRYALAEKRVVVIVDAFDELNGDQSKAITEAYRESLEMKSVIWVFTGRDYAINRKSGRGDLFHSELFRRLRISPFSDELQNEYMKCALPGVDWRESLRGRDEDWDELLGLPHTLREIVRLFQSYKTVGAIPEFESPSDLFLQCSDKMLNRELEDGKKNPPLLIDGVESSLDKRSLLERALGAIALEMACKGVWKEVSGNKAEIELKINDIIQKSRNRFCKSWVADGFDENVDQCWRWAKTVLEKFETLNGATQADVGTKVLAFSTRRVLEMRVARYLTTFATEDDLRGAGDANSALGHNGDPAWENIWKAAIKMPLSKVVPTRYRAAISLLFERPKAAAIQRRPTELMWIADRWILRKPELNGFQRELEEILGEQFRIEHDRIMQLGTDHEQRAIKELMDPDSYVFLADPNHQIDEYDTGTFEMGEPGSTVSVSLTPFGICKWTLSNTQFQFFDDNFVAAKLWDGLIPKDISHDERLKDFQGPDQPAIFLSWYDSYWYAVYVHRGMNGMERDLRKNGMRWRLSLPSEAQFEYAARAGGKGLFFRNDEGNEVSKTQLSRYAHFDQQHESGSTISVKEKAPNGWGIHQILGNVWKWVYDQYANELLGGVDPRCANDDNFGSDRVLRGSCWRYSAAFCESSIRGGYAPSDRWYDGGVVLALSPLESPSQAR